MSYFHYCYNNNSHLLAQHIGHARCKIRKTNLHYYHYILLQMYKIF